MKCPECGKRGMKPAYWQYRDQVEDGRKAYFPWIRVSETTWKEMQLHICPNCGHVKAVPTGQMSTKG